MHPLLLCAVASLPGSAGGTTTFTDGALGVSVSFDGAFTRSEPLVTTRDGVTRKTRTISVQDAARSEVLELSVLQLAKADCQALVREQATDFGRDVLKCTGEPRSDGSRALTKGVWSTTADVTRCGEPKSPRPARIRALCDSRTPGQVLLLRWAVLTTDEDDPAAQRFSCGPVLRGGLSACGHPCTLDEVLPALAPFHQPDLARRTTSAVVEACGDVLPAATREVLRDLVELEESHGPGLAKDSLSRTPAFAGAVCPGLQEQLDLAAETSVQAKNENELFATTLYRGCGYEKRQVFTLEEFAAAAKTDFGMGAVLLAVPIHARLVDRGLDPATARSVVRVMAGLDAAPASWTGTRR